LSGFAVIESRSADPIMPLLMTSRLSQQNYYPEWVVTGVALTDSDEFGQMYDASQWKHAFGLSQSGQEQPQGASYAYAAVKSVDPDHEPIFGTDYFYNYCYLLATGIQMAGPDLTPQSFAAGIDRGFIRPRVSVGALPADGGGFGRGLVQLDFDAHPFARARGGGRLRSNGPPGWAVLGRALERLLLIEIGWNQRGGDVIDG